MPRLTNNRTQCGKSRPLPWCQFWATYSKSFVLGLLAAATLAAVTILSACGGSSSGGSQTSLNLSGNWQFTVAAPADGSFFGGLQGGFLQQKSSGAVTGAAAYAVSLPQFLIPCNNGSATITGTINGQSVSLTAVAGTQTFAFTGTLTLDSSTVNGTTFAGETMTGTYSSTAGTAPDGGPCGTAQSGLVWTASLVPPISGNMLGSFHSAGGSAGLSNQDFPVSGSLTQAANTGSSSATITGTLNFGGSDYPCFNSGSNTATVYGQISGNIVSLQILGSGGSILGQIGETVGPSGATGVSPVTFGPAHNGYILQGTGPSYLVATNSCPGNLDNTATAGDYGNVCVAVESTLLGITGACPQAVTLSPSSVTFLLPQVLGEPISEQMTLANSSGAGLNNLTLALINEPTGTPVNFTETDACGPGGSPSQGEPFNLGAGQSCFVTIIFDPQQTCATDAAQCPSPVTAILNVIENLPQGENPNNETLSTVNITGTGVSGDAVSDLEHHAERN